MKTLEPLVTLIECVSVSEGRPSKSLQTGWFKTTDIYLFAPNSGSWGSDVKASVGPRFL